MRQGPRKSVKNKSVGGIGLIKSVGHDGNDQLIRNKISALHDFPRMQPRLRAQFHGFTQHVAGRQLRYPKAGNNLFCLRSLAGTRRPQQDQPH